MERISLSLLKLSVLALLISAMVPMLEGAEMAKAEAVTIEKPKMAKAEAVTTTNNSTLTTTTKAAAAGSETCHKVGEKCNQGTQIGCCEGYECIPDPKLKGKLGAEGTCKAKCMGYGEKCIQGTLVAACCEGFECVRNHKVKGVVVGTGGTCLPKCVPAGQHCTIGALTGACCDGLECVKQNKSKDGKPILGGGGICVKKTVGN